MRKAEGERTQETKCSKSICIEHDLYPTKNIVHGPEWNTRFLYFTILLLSANVSKMGLPTHSNVVCYPGLELGQI